MRHLRLVRPPGPKEPRKKPQRPPPLWSPEEASRLRAALKNARAIMGTWPCLAAAMYLGREAISAAANGRKRVSAEIAVRLARALGKPLESLYAAPASADRCPTCGRGGAS